MNRKFGKTSEAETVLCVRCSDDEQAFSHGPLVGLCQFCIENDFVGMSSELAMLQMLCVRCIDAHPATDGAK